MKVSCGNDVALHWILVAQESLSSAAPISIDAVDANPIQILPGRCRCICCQHCFNAVAMSRSDLHRQGGGVAGGGGFLPFVILAQREKIFATERRPIYLQQCIAIFKCNHAAQMACALLRLLEDIRQVRDEVKQGVLYSSADHIGADLAQKPSSRRISPFTVAQVRTSTMMAPCERARLRMKIENCSTSSF